MLDAKTMEGKALHSANETRSFLTKGLDFGQGEKHASNFYFMNWQESRRNSLWGSISIIAAL